jgi:hypothetical protein
MSSDNHNFTNEDIYTTRDTSTDFVVSSEADVVGLAVVCIWAYLIRKLGERSGKWKQKFVAYSSLLFVVTFKYTFHPMALILSK